MQFEPTTIASPWREAIALLDIPAWICRSDGSLVEVNEEARALLGLDAEELPPCDGAVRARDGSGQAFCRRPCPVRRRLEDGGRLPAFEVEIRGRRGRLIELAFGADGAEVLECFLEDGTEGDGVDYLRRVATRTRPLADALPRLSKLSPRELEVLDLLAQDEDPAGVSRRLGIRLVTVRNHIQHLLKKLGAHSVQEAIALRLLDGRPRA